MLLLISHKNNGSGWEIYVILLSNSLIGFTLNGFQSSRTLSHLYLLYSDILKKSMYTWLSNHVRINRLQSCCMAECLFYVCMYVHVLIHVYVYIYINYTHEHIYNIYVNIAQNVQLQWKLEKINNMSIKKKFN